MAAQWVEVIVVTLFVKEMRVLLKRIEVIVVIVVTGVFIDGVVVAVMRVAGMAAHLVEMIVMAVFADGVVVAMVRVTGMASHLVEVIVVMVFEVAIECTLKLWAVMVVVIVVFVVVIVITCCALNNHIIVWVAIVRDQCAAIIVASELNLRRVNLRDRCVDAFTIVLDHRSIVGNSSGSELSVGARGNSDVATNFVEGKSMSAVHLQVTVFESAGGLHCMKLAMV